MRILNRDTGDVIPNVEHKTNPLQKFVGLRFRRQGRAFFSFSRPTRTAIDMAFVLGPLDIAFLDEDMEVMEIHGALPLTLNPITWRLYRPEQAFSHVLEVEKGLLQEREVREGHELAVLD